VTVYDIVHMPPDMNEARARSITKALLDRRMEDVLPLAPRRPLPADEYEPPVLRTHVARTKVPSVVMRMDWRYGVAYPSCFDKDRAPGASGFTHCPETFTTRGEAEQHAWKLARRFATTHDWK